MITVDSGPLRNIVRLHWPKLTWDEAERGTSYHHPAFSRRPGLRAVATARSRKSLKTGPVAALPIVGYILPSIVGQGLSPAVAPGVGLTIRDMMASVVPHVLCPAIAQAAVAAVSPALHPATCTVPYSSVG